MPLRPCLDCGEPSDKPRCPRHSSLKESERPSRRVLGRYDTRYLRLRAVKLREQPWCSECRTPGSEANPLEVDHVVPLLWGGKNVKANLAVLCRFHNRSKGARLLAKG